MKLEQLAHAVEIANTGSFSKAAENLYLSQPGLSASIKQLEQELGAELFVRSRSGIALTAAGNTFIPYAKKVLQQIGTMRQLCRENAGTVSQSLSVASFYYRWAGAVMAMLVNRHADARFVNRNGIVSECVEWVANGVCDVGLVCFYTAEEAAFRKQMKSKQLQYQVIYRATPKVVIGKGHPLYDTDVTQVSRDFLRQYPRIRHDPTNSKDYYRSVFLHTEERVIVTDHATFHEMLSFTPCYCLGYNTDVVYQNVPRPSHTRELELVSDQPLPTLSVAWIAPAGMENLPLVQEYIQLLTDVCLCPDFWQKHPEINRDTFLF